MSVRTFAQAVLCSLAVVVGIFSPAHALTEQELALLWQIY
jgi:hypothetical protein